MARVTSRDNKLERFVSHRFYHCAPGRSSPARRCSGTCRLVISFELRLASGSRLWLLARHCGHGPRRAVTVRVTAPASPADPGPGRSTDIRIECHGPPADVQSASAAFSMVAGQQIHSLRCIFVARLESRADLAANLRLGDIKLERLVSHCQGFYYCVRSSRCCSGT